MTGPYFGIMTYVAFFGFVPGLDSGFMTDLNFSELWRRPVASTAFVVVAAVTAADDVPDAAVATADGGDDVAANDFAVVDFLVVVWPLRVATAARLTTWNPYVLMRILPCRLSSTWLPYRYR